MKKVSDFEMVKIVMSTVEEYLWEDFLTRPQPAPMKQINILLDCLESRLYDRLDLVHLRNVLLISDRFLLINLANRLGLTLTCIEKTTERSTGKKVFSTTTGSSSSANQVPTTRTNLKLIARNVYEEQIPQFGIHVISAETLATARAGERVHTDIEDTWSTTALDGSNPQSKSRNKQLASAAMSAQQAELIERAFVKAALAKDHTEEVASGKEACKRLEKAFVKATLAKDHTEEVASRQKHVRGYPSSSSHSFNHHE